mmetsp:Transcript_117107/g.303774  ORF Transcript_117107/g.303774 Transcript_117107/m.303774 type:complete len:509 (-) Transcript_117107:64-1590(-)
MSAQCFLTYAEGSSSEEEFEDVIGRRTLQRSGQAMGEQRSYCSCGKPLRRVANLPGHAALLHCGSSHDCQRCGDRVLAGELHFRCSKCEDVRVCKDCGPGVYIGHTFDFVDQATGEQEVQEIPSRVLHYRKARQNKRKRATTRGLTLGGDQQERAQALNLAEKVIENARDLMEHIQSEGEDTKDNEWGDATLLGRLLGADGQEHICFAMKVLADGVSQILASSPTLQEVKVPCKVYGDIHGQLRDLLLLFGSFGFPGSPECPSAVFNGDFVDRGTHQVEVIALLFALKIAYPSNVFLNRGNHEDAHMNAKYGFQGAVFAALGEQGPDIFERIVAAFSYLPLASLIEDKILVVHGGIGDGKWTLDDLRRVRRPLKHADLQIDCNQWLWNLLWSDPIEDDENASSSRLFGIHSSPRGKLAVKFGWNVTQAFCAANGLDLVIRSHQAKREGLGFDVMHNESLIRVFSARDYEGHDNDCAVLSITSSEEGVADPSNGVLNVRPQVLSSISRG